MLIARRREISLRAARARRPSSLFVAWALVSVFWSQDASGLVLELGLDRRARLPRGRRSGTCATRCRPRARSATCCACCCRSRSASRCSRASSSTCPSGFLGIQGNIAQLGPIQGIFGTRNLLGFVAVIALITFLIEYRTQSVRAGRLGVLGRPRRGPGRAQRLPHRPGARRRRSASPSARWRSCGSPRPSAARRCSSRSAASSSSG